jgi:predicted ArsR family transcriptional regulator
MHESALGARFRETTRGQIVALLRRADRTVEELARALSLTDNAVRNQLSALERDGLVRSSGVRRGAGAGKPAVLYQLRPEATPLLSRAYAPVLGTLMDVLVEELPPARSEALLREVGRRLGRSVGGRAVGDLDARIRAAADVLIALGGDVDVESDDAGRRLEGAGCPLSGVVCHRPETCHAVEALLTEVIGAPVRSMCEHGSRPRCRFAIPASAA